MIIHGDCLEALKELPDNYVDSVVTDPPYGLSFMGKKWDYDVPSEEIWREALRVLKPGGHLLSFCGTRTYHRMVVRIEDAGFEIRDQIQWIYGSGFPKSLDVSKAIDKAAGAEREVVGKSHDKKYSSNGVTSGTSIGGIQGGHNYKSEFSLTAPSTDAAKQWQGWGTALKPANEPICVARKPLEKGLTVAQNVQKWGTGAINVDASRIGSEVISTHGGGDKYAGLKGNGSDGVGEYKTHVGRFPANVIFDEDAAAMLDEQSGVLSKPGNKKPANISAHNGFEGKSFAIKARSADLNKGDSGGASRFFYVAKASKSERFSYLTCNCETVNQDLWEKQDQSQNEQTDFTSQPKDTCEKRLDENSSLGTLLNGKGLTDLSHPECKSTTLITTRSTTESEISSLSPRLSTNEFTQGANNETANGLSHVNCAETLSESTQKIGTSQKKDGHCMGVAAHATLAESLKTSVCAGCGKSPSSEGHPTQKPTKLMGYLIRMVTPIGGTVLDPFCGSGSTGVAAKRLGFEFIGIEREIEYVAIANKRIESV